MNVREILEIKTVIYTKAVKKSLKCHLFWTILFHVIDNFNYISHVESATKSKCTKHILLLFKLTLTVCWIKTVMLRHKLTFFLVLVVIFYKVKLKMY